ncbi:MAG TPA: DUF167 domain-containing protein [Bacteroidia bacterium]|jgi:hypothetical protein|nr:DUF167 domain-containing protein [Bacteroidia bacterium]
MIRIAVQVKPNASKDEIQMDESGNLLIKIKEVPADGAANAYLLKFLSKAWEIPKSSIELEKGETSRFKKLLLHMDRPAFDAILQRYKK